MPPHVNQLVDRYKAFADTIALVPQDPLLVSEDFRPSIVLLQNQRLAFTHDRGDGALLLEATEWIFEEDYRRCEEQYRRIELAAVPYFARRIDVGPSVTLTNTL